MANQAVDGIHQRKDGRWLTYDPMDGVQRPKYRAPKKKVKWSANDLQQFLAGTDGFWLNPLFTVLAGSGCRLSEALGLRWDDVDNRLGRSRQRPSTPRAG